MSIDYRTPAEREADRARLEKDVAEHAAADARVDAAVSQDVAEGMATRADLERARAESENARANTYAVQNARQADHLDVVRAQRNRAEVEGQYAAADAGRNALAFWLLLGIVAAGLIIGYIAWANRPAPESNTTIISPEVRPATPAPALVQPVPAPAPAPVVIEKQVPVDRPVAVPVPVPVNNGTAAPSATPAPMAPEAPAGQPPSNSDRPLNGYVEPNGSGNAGNAGSGSGGQ
jgi:hypothetical protein